MLRFFTRAFAIIGIIVTALVLAIIVGGICYQERAVTEPKSVVLVLDLDQPIVEQSNQSPLDLALHSDSIQLFDILHAIDQAKYDPHVKAIVARFGSMQPSLSQAQEIRSALERFRAGKKPTYAFGTDYGQFGLGNRAYYLASDFENIWLQPVGSVGLSGVAIESPFAKTALDKIGVQADFMQREEYKSFMEPGMRDDYSPLVKTEMQEMITDLSNQIAEGIAFSRKWDIERVNHLMEAGPFTDDEALKAGLVTHIGYADELEDELKQKIGKDMKEADVGDYLGYKIKAKGSSGKTSSKDVTKIALIYGTGLIMDRAVGSDTLGEDHIMGADTIAGAFDDATEDKDVKAIIFRIDSPGGSPAASETIRRAMIHAQNAGKPVFVSMGDVAASGGYWIAMNGDFIAAEPGTLTGSIGVIAGKFVLGGLMQKIGVNWDTLKTTENAGMWSMTEGFSTGQRERMNALLDQTYHIFVQDVSSARKIPMEKMPDIAKGRVWTGSQAIKIGLIDELGGYDVTLAAMRKKLALAPEDPVALEQFPAPETPAEKMLKLLRGLGAESAMVRTSLAQWQNLQAMLSPVLGGMTGMTQPLAARMSPTALQVIR